MMPVIRSDHMARIDEVAQTQYSLPSTVLMENAGIKLHRRLSALYADLLAVGPTVVLVGKGNNGGDGLVIARQAATQGSTDISVVYLSDELTGDPATHMAACRALGIPMHQWPSDDAREAVSNAALIVDAVFGTGIRGALRGSGADLVSAANECDAVRVAIDVPSGLGDEFEPGFPAFAADTTLTVELAKRCLYLPAARPFCGTIETVSIGFPKALLFADDEEAELVRWDDVGTYVKSLPESSYKKTRGVVGIFAGAVGTTGAAVLASLGCARSRAGLVHLYVDREIYPAIASMASSVLVHPLSDSMSTFDGFTALLIGPGWGRSKDRASMLRSAAIVDVPAVVDADGLNVLAECRSCGESITFQTTAVLTPHPGECARLTGVGTGKILADPVPHCRRLALETDAVIVMKSHVTYIVPPEGRVLIVDGMNAALGTGGSGDVLAGVIAGLRGSGASAVEAAVGGVLLHTEAGRRCRLVNGWFLADDLPPTVGTLFDEVRQS